MLSVSGKAGKSIIADVLKEHLNARVYSYGEDICIWGSYHVQSNECDVKEFCEFVFDDIHELGNETLPLRMVVIYTNLSDVDEIGVLEDYARTLEQNNMVTFVVIMHK